MTRTERRIAAPRGARRLFGTSVTGTPLDRPAVTGPPVTDAPAADVSARHSAASRETVR